MRLFRSSILTAVAGFALAARPALAHQAPLPPVAGADYAAHSEAPPPMPPHSDMRPDMPPQPGQPRMGYSREERDGWLAECAHRLSDSGPRDERTRDEWGREERMRDERARRDDDIGRARAQCESYLGRYEASQGGGSYAQYQTWSYGPGAAAPVAAPSCGPAGCSYPAAPPGMMWVPVILSGGQNCCCQQKPKVRTIVTEEEVPEKVVTYETPPKIVHTKYTRTVPVKSVKPIKSIKSTK